MYQKLKLIIILTYDKNQFTEFQKQIMNKVSMEKKNNDTLFDKHQKLMADNDKSRNEIEKIEKQNKYLELCTSNLTKKLEELSTYCCIEPNNNHDTNYLEVSV